MIGSFALGCGAAVFIPSIVRKLQHAFQPAAKEHSITTQEALRDLLGSPSNVTKNKELSRLDEHCVHFIKLSPFLVIGSSNRKTSQHDVSPKGDPPGFVQVLDRGSRLLIPERVGNRRLDTLSNLLTNPKVSLIFFVPGLGEELRVMGSARITDDPVLLMGLTEQGITPKAAVEVIVEKAFFHCAKAVLRSRIWDPSTHIPQKKFVTMGQLMKKHSKLSIDSQELDKIIEEEYRNNLYGKKDN